jgi:hypothetical protein
MVTRGLRTVTHIEACYTCRANTPQQIVVRDGHQEHRCTVCGQTGGMERVEGGVKGHYTKDGELPLATNACERHPDEPLMCLNRCHGCAVEEENAFYAAHDSHDLDMMMYGGDS